MALPFSKPGLPSSCCAALELMVRAMVVVWVRLPDVPVIVTVAAPVVAVALAVSVSTLVLVVLAGLKLAVTPLGRPEAERLTEPVKPLTGVTVMVLVPLLPWIMATLAGEAESEKFGVATALTVSVMVVLWVKLPEVPVMVTVAVPVVAVLLAVKVTVLVVVALAGLKDAVTPLGSPEADKLTLPLNPLMGVTVTVLLPLPPCVTETLAGEADSEKFGTAAAFTVRVTVVV